MVVSSLFWYKIGMCISGISTFYALWMLTVVSSSELWSLSSPAAAAAAAADDDDDDGNVKMAA